MFKKAKFFFGFVPPEVVTKYYNDTTVELERRLQIRALSKRLPAHITVIPPFFIRTQSEFDTVMQITQMFAMRQMVPTVAIGGVGVFSNDPKNQTVYLKVGGTRGLTIVAEGLAATLSNSYGAPINPYPEYTPHLSIARHLTQKQCEEVCKHLQETGTPFFEDIKLSVLMLFRFEQYRYECCQEVPLGRTG